MYSPFTLILLLLRICTLLHAHGTHNYVMSTTIDPTCYTASDFLVSFVESSKNREHLQFKVFNKRQHRLVKPNELVRMHDKLAHIMIVSESLNLFGHIHPDDFEPFHNASNNALISTYFDFKDAKKWYVHVDLHVAVPSCPGSHHGMHGGMHGISAVALSLDVTLDFPDSKELYFPTRRTITKSVVPAMPVDLASHLSDWTALTSPLHLSRQSMTKYLVRSPELSLFSASTTATLKVNQCHSFLFHFSEILQTYQSNTEFKERPLYNQLSKYLNGASHVTAIHQSSKQIIHLHGSAVSLSDAELAKHNVYSASKWREIFKFDHQADLDVSFVNKLDNSPFIFDQQWRSRNKVDMCLQPEHHHVPNEFGPWISVPIQLPKRGWWKLILQTAVKGDTVLVPWFWINAA